MHYEAVPLHSAQAIMNRLHSGVQFSNFLEQMAASPPRLTFYNAFLATLIFLTLKFAFTIIYRLYLSPLAEFPGPKIAAVSRLYEFWYQGIKRTEFPDVIKEMHRVYG